MTTQRSSVTASESRSSHDAARDHLLCLIARLLARQWCRLQGRQPQEAAFEKSSTTANTRRFDHGDSAR
ncbi:MAG TPA: hypothetical protein VH643_03645 [Gemmataceae bacterium]|jgi:hypothetical protein